jgi:hypothetical protein
MMSEIALQLEYSVEADVSPAFAWRFRTDVANWNDPPARFNLDGPFEAGSCGTTLLPGQEPLHWCIRDVLPGKSFVLELQLDRAMLTFEWRFDDLPGHRTKLTQHIVLSGDNAGAYAEQVEVGFGPNLPDGMRRIAAEMAAAEERSASPRQEIAGARYDSDQFLPLGQNVGLGIGS